MITAYDIREGKPPESVIYETVQAFADAKSTAEWIACEKLTQAESILLGECLGLHPMVSDELYRGVRRASMEDYGEYAHVVLNTVSVAKSGRTRVTKVQMVLWKNRVLTVCDRPEETFVSARGLLDGMRTGKNRINRLFCLLAGDVLTGYCDALETLGESIDLLEDELLRTVEKQQLEQIHSLKNAVTGIRRALWPMGQSLSMVIRGGADLIVRDVYFRDLNDEVLRLCELAESYRDTLADMTDFYMTAVNNNMNEVMKTLTLVSTIFIPITFLSGLYGMNFRYMPELSRVWGYPAVLSLMAVTVTGMLVYFRRKKWL
ncbi:MAG: magnesium/cobalt transporter CorA [Oscillospiraceae bacterium]